MHVYIYILVLCLTQGFIELQVIFLPHKASFILIFYHCLASAYVFVSLNIFLFFLH